MNLDPRMRKMLIALGVLFGVIFLYKLIMGLIIAHAMRANQNPIVTVSAMPVTYSAWQPEVKASGSLRAIRGVNVTTEVAGIVQWIYFIPGTLAKQGEALIQLNADVDTARLNSLQAVANLAYTTYKRDKAQYAVHAISKAVLDTDEADLKSKQAQVEEQAALLLKKTIQVPFTGHLGISAVNPGQYLNPGDKIVTLQELDPIYVDFYVPQQTVTQLKQDQPVMISVDVYPNKIFFGKISTIEPIVDSSNRNVQVEATLPNTKFELVPGMFASVLVRTDTPQRHLTLPHTAISFNPYGEVAFIVHDNIVTQTFVTTGETRGDQIAVLQGLKEGDVVVTSGQLKLKNGSRVKIDNTIVPENNPHPRPVDE